MRGYGQKVPVHHVENVIGSRYDDTITGDDTKNTLLGGRGDDTLFGKANDDILWGNSPWADPQNGDFAYGGPGFDQCDGVLPLACEVSP